MQLGSDSSLWEARVNPDSTPCPYIRRAAGESKVSNSIFSNPRVSSRRFLVTDSHTGGGTPGNRHPFPAGPRDDGDETLGCIDIDVIDIDTININAVIDLDVLDIFAS